MPQLQTNEKEIRKSKIINEINHRKKDTINMAINDSSILTSAVSFFPSDSCSERFLCVILPYSSSHYENIAINFESNYVHQMDRPVAKMSKKYCFFFECVCVFVFVLSHDQQCVFINDFSGFQA